MANYSNNKKHDPIKINKYGDSEVSFRLVILSLWQYKIVIFTGLFLSVCIAFYLVNMRSEVYELSSRYEVPVLGHIPINESIFDNDFEISGEALLSEFHLQLQSEISSQKFLSQDQVALSLNKNKPIVKADDVRLSVVKDLGDVVLKCRSSDKELCGKLMSSYEGIAEHKARKSLEHNFFEFKKNREYALRAKEKSLQSQKNSQLDYRIKLYKEAFLVAKELGIKSPIGSAASVQKNFGQVAESTLLFERGTEQLSAMIRSLERQKNNVDFIQGFVEIGLEKERLDQLEEYLKSIGSYTKRATSKPSVLIMSPAPVLVYVVTLMLGLIISCICVLLFAVVKSSNKTH